MSPRAAWQLEALGFPTVYDYSGGKVEWLAHALPTEGRGPHHAVAGEVMRTDVPTCAMDATAGSVRAILEEGPEAFCVVVNEPRIVLGRIRRRELPADDSMTAFEFMKPGPSTIRPWEPLRPLAERMLRRGVGTVLVSTKRGHLLGVVHRDDAERRLAELEAPTDSA